MELNSIVEPIVRFVSKVEGPLLILVGIAGAVYIVYLVAKLILSPGSARANAISHLITAVVAYFLIFILIALLKAYTPALMAMVNGEGTDALFNVNVDLSKPIEDAKQNYENAKQSISDGSVSANIKENVQEIIGAGDDLIHEEMDGIPEAIQEIGDNLPDIENGENDGDSN